MKSKETKKVKLRKVVEVTAKEAKRLKAIKFKSVIFPKECSLCHNKFYNEKMWKFNRWGINKSVHAVYYCQNCMHSEEDVLNEIDTDESGFGIAFVDDFMFFKKKDCTRIKEMYDSAFGRS